MSAFFEAVGVLTVGIVCLFVIMVLLFGLFLEIRDRHDNHNSK